MVHEPPARAPGQRGRAEPCRRWRGRAPRRRSPRVPPARGPSRTRAAAHRRVPPRVAASRGAAIAQLPASASAHTTAPVAASTACTPRRWSSTSTTSPAAPISEPWTRQRSAGGALRATAVAPRAASSCAPWAVSAAWAVLATASPTATGSATHPRRRAGQGRRAARSPSSSASSTSISAPCGAPPGTDPGYDRAPPPAGPGGRQPVTRLSGSSRPAAVTGPRTSAVRSTPAAA